MHVGVSWYLGVWLDVCEQIHINMHLLYVCIYSTYIIRYYSEQVVLDAGYTIVNKTEMPALMELTS